MHICGFFRTFAADFEMYYVYEKANLPHGCYCHFSMSDYDKIMESIHGLIGVFISIFVDIVLLILCGAFAVALIFN